METHPDDLKNLERRLAACVPATAGLDADAMLFAAGRASVRPGASRIAWASLAGCLAALAAILGVWLAAEHRERLTLAQQLRDLTPTQPRPPSLPAEEVPSGSPAPEEPAPNSLFTSRPALEKGLDAWPPADVPRVETPGSVPPDPTVLRVGRPDSLPDL